MTKSLPFALLSGAALLCGTTAIAQMKPAAKSTTAAKTTMTKTTMTAKPAMASKPMAAKPAMASKQMASHGRMVTTKTSTGKSITYDCSKAGNATKAACKKG